MDFQHQCAWRLSCKLSLVVEGVGLTLRYTATVAVSYAIGTCIEAARLEQKVPTGMSTPCMRHPLPNDMQLSASYRTPARHYRTKYNALEINYAQVAFSNNILHFYLGRCIVTVEGSIIHVSTSPILLQL